MNRVYDYSSVIRISTSKTFKGHTGVVLSVVYFSSPLNFIISCSGSSCSGDRTIRIWNKQTQVCENIISEHSDVVNQIMKWSQFEKEGIFISCSSDEFMKCFSMKEYAQQVEVIKVTKMNNSVRGLLKLNEKHFLVLTKINEYDFGELYLLEYDSFKKKKKIEIQIYTPYLFYSKLLKSINFKDCFYVNGIHKIALIHPKIGIKKLVKDDNDTTMSIFLNKKKEEVLIYGNSGFEFVHLYYCNLGSSNEEKTELYSRRINMNVFVSLKNLTILNNKYILGTYWGFIYICEIDENYGVKEIGRSKNHGDPMYVTKINDLKIIKEEENKIEILTCSNDRTIKIYSILNTVRIKRKKILKIINEKCKKYIQDKIYNDYTNKEVNEDELESMIVRISKEYFKNTPEEDFRVYKELNIENVLIPGYKSDFFFQNDNIFSFGDFSFREEKVWNKEFFRNGFGCEFLRTNNSKKYKLFFIGEFKNGKKEGKGRIMSKNGVVEGLFVGGKIDLLSFEEEIRKILKNIFREKVLLELHQKRRTVEELQTNNNLYECEEKWVESCKSLKESLFREVAEEYRLDIKDLVLETPNFNLYGSRNDPFLFFGFQHFSTNGFGIYFNGKRVLFSLERSKLNGLMISNQTKYFLPTYVGEFKKRKEKIGRILNDEDFFTRLLNKYSNFFLEEKIESYFGLQKSKEELEKVIVKEIIEKCVKKYEEITNDDDFAFMKEGIVDFLQAFSTENYIYIGNFFHQIKNGNNMFIWNGFGCEFIRTADNNYRLFYVGEFKNGKREGKGKIILSKKHIVEGMFKNGRIHWFSVKEAREDVKEILEKALDEEFCVFFEKKRTRDDLMISSESWKEKWKEIIEGLSIFKGLDELIIRKEEILDCENIIFRQGEDDSFLYFGLDLKIAVGFGIEFVGKKASILLQAKYYVPIYAGEFKNGKRDGKGKIFDNKNMKKVYEGEFKRGKKQGRGIEFFNGRDGNSFFVFKGNFENDIRNGHGRAYNFKKKVYYDGIWKLGVLEKIKNQFKCCFFSYDEIKKHLTHANRIGEGAFGDVYRIKSAVINLKGVGEFVAVKVIKDKFDRDDRELMFKQMIKKGIKLCADVEDKENFLETLGVFKTVKTVGCIMKCCRTSIDKEIIERSGRISDELKIHYLHGVSKGMKNLHKANIMHRDLKWGNVLLTYDNKIKITDFDTLKEDERSWNLKISSLTSNVGTPGYCAPETYYGNKYGMECDVFSFGIMMYSLLFEEISPFASHVICNCGNRITLKALLQHVADCNLRPQLDQYKIKKYPRLIDLMILCWEKEPLKRPSFEDIYHILSLEKSNLLQLFNNQTNENFKSYFLLEITFPEHNQYFNIDKLLLLQKYEKMFYKKIVEYLTTKKYRGCKIKNLDYNQGGIYDNFDVLRLLKEDNPVIQVEFSEFIKPEISVKKTENEIILEKEVKELKLELKNVQEGNMDEIINLKEENERKERENHDLKEEVKKKENKKDEYKLLLKKFFQKKGYSFGEFTKFMNFQKEEIEGEDDDEEKT